MTQSVERVTKPVPRPDDASRPFFEGAARHALMIQRCSACRTYLAPGSLACDECLAASDALEWVEASGRGTLFSFAIMHRAYHPAFADEIPYNVALVELDEGPRLPSNVVGVANEALRVGMLLEVTFEEVGEGVTLPKFRPRV
jgi:uncharacterized OB-fold protein